MAKGTAPLLSFGASGQIGKTMVFASWKGRQYTRRHVVPANPQSTEQTKTRSLFSWLNDVYKLLPASVTDNWTMFASGQVLTNRNAFIGQNVAAMRGDVLATNMIMYTAAKGGTAPPQATFTAGVGKITVASADPVLPAGWGVVGFHATVIRDQNPQSAVLFASTSGVDAASPFTLDLTGLTATFLYRGFAAFALTKDVVGFPTRIDAWSPQSIGSATPT